MPSVIEIGDGGVGDSGAVVGGAPAISPALRSWRLRYTRLLTDGGKFAAVKRKVLRVISVEP